MPRLKLSEILDDKPVRLTVELPASVHRDLLAYAKALSAASAGGTVEASRLVAPMLARFMATDRVFLKLKAAPPAPAGPSGAGA
ncbi:DUF2274 domain-containing protein [Caulobacter sp. S45]|uniref:DUF2274 domain-containing protein n=1 Tax=Caulobacter sp. S45 TaxID=1641861 RepID=UPI00131B9E0F|nr:DUF2274 domain-containing protein [Caulobacter sp. S45]